MSSSPWNTEQKNAKIRPPLGITTKSDFVFAQPGPEAVATSFGHLQIGVVLTRELPAGLAVFPPIKGSVGAIGRHDLKSGNRLWLVGCPQAPEFGTSTGNSASL
jgi:hypothetical protein